MAILRNAWEFQKKRPGLTAYEAIIWAWFFFVGLQGGHHPLVAAFLAALVAAGIPLFASLLASVESLDAKDDKED